MFKFTACLLTVVFAAAILRAYIKAPGVHAFRLQFPVKRVLVLGENRYSSSLTVTENVKKSVEVVIPVENNLKLDPNSSKLISKHVSEETFNYAVNHARSYNAGVPGELIAGVVPHHLTAAQLIGGFFRAAAENSYDTVIIIGPNHSPRLQDNGEIVTSLKGWEEPGGAESDVETVREIMKIALSEGTVIEDDERMEDDHAVSSLVPFVNHYWPEAKVAPVLISKSLSYSDTLLLADGLTEIIKTSDKRVLLLCSIDFSHYLSPRESRIHDEETRKEIKKAGYGTIHSFTNANVDSPASLIIFLRYLKNSCGYAEILDNTDASEFTNIGGEGTTSYFVIAGKKASPL